MWLRWALFRHGFYCDFALEPLMLSSSLSTSVAGNITVFTLLKATCVKKSIKKEQSGCGGSWERFPPCAAPSSLQGEGEGTLGPLPVLATKAVLANHSPSINHGRIGLHLPQGGQEIQLLNCLTSFHWQTRAFFIWQGVCRSHETCNCRSERQVLASSVIFQCLHPQNGTIRLGGGTLVLPG